MGTTNITDTVITVDGITSQCPTAIFYPTEQFYEPKPTYNTSVVERTNAYTNDRDYPHATSSIQYTFNRSEHLRTGESNSNSKLHPPKTSTLHEKRAFAHQLKGIHPYSFATFHGTTANSNEERDRPRLESLFSLSDMNRLSAYAKRPAATNSTTNAAATQVASRNRLSKKFSKITVEPVIFPSDTGNNNSKSNMAGDSQSDARSVHSMTGSAKSFYQTKKKYYQQHRKKKSNQQSTPTEIFARNLSEAVLDVDDSCDDGYVYNTKTNTSHLYPPLISPTLYFDLSTSNNGDKDTSQNQKHHRRSSSYFALQNNHDQYIEEVRNDNEDSYFPDYFQYQENQQQTPRRPRLRPTVSELPSRGNLKSFYLSAILQSKFEENRRKFFQQQKSRKPPSPSFYLVKPPIDPNIEDEHDERRRVSSNDEEEALLENTPLLHYSATNSSLLARRMKLQKRNSRRKRTRWSTSSKLGCLFRCCFCKTPTTSNDMSPVSRRSVSMITPMDRPRFSSIRTCFHLTLSIGSVVGVLCVTSMLYLM